MLAVGILAGITTSVVFALNYEGEDFCQDSPAWPNGTYLGQMHPYHSDFYRGYAERRGWDPCTTWANDQRNSAIRGLRELGYTVTAPGEPPVAGRSFSLDGSGTTTRNITLVEGLWTVSYSVTGNVEHGSGTNFIVKVEAVAGGAELIANEITAALSGTTTMRVGQGLLALTPGKSVVSVNAAPNSSWTLMFTRQ